MKEPILSREEVEALAHRICARYIHSENIHLRQYTFGITTLEQLVDAILEKLCGEPVAWMVLAANTGSPCEVTLHKIETEALRQDCVIPLYSIKEKHHG
ncbi:hypothetical protein QZM42_33540 [Burkholderia vietnamiensis]|uniref:hypothetical protein n=1 Tax=Burkholderia vietnamiensis TaxID=60552 RepID=UPI00265278F6|nr:hypothetical protein [Burkholderia vietnamiensis]MDN7413451.1 hypothetical protein [Burkholderia vietnamiensis]